MSTTRVGVVGYHYTPFDIDLAERILREVFDIIGDDGATEHVVVIRLTGRGIPDLARHEATRRGWPVEGVGWDTRSDVFLPNCDVLVRVGGGGRAHREADAFYAAGGTVYEYELTAVDA